MLFTSAFAVAVVVDYSAMVYFIDTLWLIGWGWNKREVGRPLTIF